MTLSRLIIIDKLEVVGLFAIISITINMEPDMAASHIPFQLVPKLQ